MLVLTGQTKKAPGVAPPPFPSPDDVGCGNSEAPSWLACNGGPVDWLPALLMMGGALIVVSLLIAWLIGRWLR